MITYATEILEHFPKETSWEVLSSQYCEEQQPAQNRQKVKTYLHLRGFIFATLFRLPFFIWKVFRLHKEKKYTAFYFPYSHAWDYFFILLAKWLKIKTIVTVHDGVMHTGEAEPIQQFLIKRTIQNADKLIFLSQFVETLVQQKFSVQNTPTFIIPHGLLSPPLLNRNKRKLPPKAKLLFLGRIGKYKGIELLLEAMEELDPEKYEYLTIAGKFLYEANVSTSNTDKIKWETGWLEQSRISELINTHDLLILPYLEATQSGVVALGTAACLPMVLSDVGGLKEQVYPNYPFLVSPTKEQLIIGISQALENPPLYQQVSNDLQKWSKQFKWDTIAKQVLEVIAK